VSERARARTGKYLLSAAAAVEIPSDFTASETERERVRERERRTDAGNDAFSTTAAALVFEPTQRTVRRRYTIIIIIIPPHR